MAVKLATPANRLAGGVQADAFRLFKCVRLVAIALK